MNMIGVSGGGGDGGLSGGGSVGGNGGVCDTWHLRYSPTRAKVLIGLLYCHTNTLYGISD